MRLLLLTTLVIALANQAQAEDTENRDIRSYEDGGTVHFSMLEGDSSANFGKVRDFLWKHWKERRRGKIVTTGSSIEGAPGRTSYFVEPDERGAWRITAEGESGVLKPGTSEQITGRYDAYEVIRIKPRKKLDETPIPLDDSAQVAPKSYRLLLKDRNNAVIEEF
jgi:hypothetical protein